MHAATAQSPTTQTHQQHSNNTPPLLPPPPQPPLPPPTTTTTTTKKKKRLRQTTTARQWQHHASSTAVPVSVAMVAVVSTEAFCSDHSSSSSWICIHPRKLNIAFHDWIRNFYDVGRPKTNYGATGSVAYIRHISVIYARDTGCDLYFHRNMLQHASVVKS